jgi:hypothetical protein
MWLRIYGTPGKRLWYAMRYQYHSLRTADRIFIKAISHASDEGRNSCIVFGIDRLTNRQSLCGFTKTDVSFNLEDGGSIFLRNVGFVQDLFSCGAERQCFFSFLITPRMESTLTITPPRRQPFHVCIKSRTGNVPCIWGSPWN